MCMVCRGNLIREAVRTERAVVYGVHLHWGSVLFRGAGRGVAILEDHLHVELRTQQGSANSLQLEAEDDV